MINWDTVKSEFVWEGSWRDICVPDVGLREWGAAVNAVRGAGYRERFRVNGVTSEMPDDAATLFRRTEEVAILWSVFVAGVQLNCHFFNPCEIEFDLDPREVTGQTQLDGVVSFMLALAEVTDRPALLTPENMHAGPFLRIGPAGEIEYISSEGFFEALAHGRL